MELKKKNEPSKWEIDLISMLAISFMLVTFNVLAKMLDLEEVEKNKKKEVKHETS